MGSHDPGDPNENGPARGDGADSEGNRSDDTRRAAVRQLREAVALLRTEALRMRKRGGTREERAALALLDALADFSTARGLV